MNGERRGTADESGRRDKSGKRSTTLLSKQGKRSAIARRGFFAVRPRLVEKIPEEN